MSTKAHNALRDVPGPLRPLLPELCAALRVELVAAHAALEARRLHKGAGEPSEDPGRGAAGDALRPEGPDAAAKSLHNIKGAAMRFGLHDLAVHADLAHAAVIRGDLGEAATGLAGCENILERVEKICGEKAEKAC